MRLVDTTDMITVATKVALLVFEHNRSKHHHDVKADATICSCSKPSSDDNHMLSHRFNRMV